MGFVIKPKWLSVAQFNAQSSGSCRTRWRHKVRWIYAIAHFIHNIFKLSFLFLKISSHTQALCRITWQSKKANWNIFYWQKANTATNSCCALCYVRKPNCRWFNVNWRDCVKNCRNLPSLAWISSRKMPQFSRVKKRFSWQNNTPYLKGLIRFHFLFALRGSFKPTHKLLKGYTARHNNG